MNQALKFETHNVHLDKFVFTLNKNEILTGSDDCMIKVFNTNSNSKSIVETIDVTDEVRAISYGCGILAYGQGNNLQMVQLEFSSDSENKNSTFNPNSSILLTSFNSNVKNITFNEKLNLLLAFSEDDDLHVINLTNLDVFKYKSNHEGSLKNMRVNPKGEFLITTGCDGYLNIYEFNQNDDLGKITSKKKIRLCQKLPYESLQMLEVSVNNMNLCAISGNILLKTLQLDTMIPAENLNVVVENSISHKNDISNVKWVANNILITGDLSGIFKIWNFSNKSCIYQLESNKVVQTLFTYEYANPAEFAIIFNDDGGNLNISDKVTHASITDANASEICVNKYQDSNLKFVINEKVDKNSEIPEIAEICEDILNLSDLEDENGEIKAKDEIEKAKEKRAGANTSGAENKLESIADEILGCLPQQSFFSSATNVNNFTSSRFLLWNMIGQIVSRQESAFKAIDITFADISTKKKITYIDTNDLCYAVMNNCGALLSNKLDEENEDEYEKDDAKQNAVLIFKSIHANVYSLLKDWSVTLPAKENPIALAIGVDWCAVYTSLQYLRVFSLYGNEKIVISLSHVISMAGYENYLACVYHSSAPLYGCQSLRFKILNSENFFNEIYDGVLPISPEAILTWFSFSEDGVLLTCDSRKVIRGFVLGVCNNWLPLLNFEQIYENLNINFWVLGMQDEEIYGVEFKNFHPEPQVGSKVPIKVHKVKLPFTSNTSNTSNPEELLFQHSLFIKHDSKRFESLNPLKEFRNVRAPDFYYTDNLKDESDIHKRKLQHDKLALSLMNDFISGDNAEKVVVLFESLMLGKSREKALQICSYHGIANLEQLLKDKEKIINFKENFNITNRPPNTNYTRSDFEDNHMNNHMNNNFSSHNSAKKQTIHNSSHKNNNPLSSFAINIDNMKALEEEVRNELGIDYLQEEYKSSSKDDLSNCILEGKANFVHLEKKNSNPFVKSTGEALAKQNMNIFDDLSKTLSASNLLTSKPTATNPNELNFKDINQKIGFKRKANELVQSPTLAKEIPEYSTGKKMKKN